MRRGFKRCIQGAAAIIAATAAGVVLAQPEAPSRRVVSADGMTISAITSEVVGPGYGIARTDQFCASTPNNEKGGVCYRVCATGIPGATAITSRSYEWRIANLGDGTPFDKCESGATPHPESCRAFNDEYYVKEIGDATCATFLISGPGSGRTYDLRLNVTLKAPLSSYKQKTAPAKREPGSRSNRKGPPV